MPHTCGLHSVGVLATAHSTSKYLLIERSDGKGYAPVAGHIYTATAHGAGWF